MVHIFTSHKESSRFPGKNAVLLPYTVSWLDRAIPLLGEQSRVYCAGDRLGGIPKDWKFVPADTSIGHLGVLRAAECAASPVEGDVCVLVQFTQPLREPSLLRRAVELCRGTGKTVVSATEMPDPEWRRMGADGTWSSYKSHDRVLYHDGRIYAWQPGHVADIFDSSAEHAVVLTSLPFIVDVGDPEDWPVELQSIVAR